MPVTAVEMVSHGSVILIELAGSGRAAGGNFSATGGKLTQHFGDGDSNRGSHPDRKRYSEIYCLNE